MIRHIHNDGLLLCAKYAASPNFFGYCGPAKSSSLIDHLHQGIGDKEIEIILSEFETLYPYLRFIAKTNRIQNPFDYRVVEAYWIGNRLLKTIHKNDYISLLSEVIQIQKKTEKKGYTEIIKKLHYHNALPHHNFHVLNMFKNTSLKISKDIAKVMDECRIGWGFVEGEVGNTNKKCITVKTQTLIMKNDVLILGGKVKKHINLDYKGIRYKKIIKKGEWVSFHWGYLCDTLTPLQVESLKYYTKQAIHYFNQKI